MRLFALITVMLFIVLGWPGSATAKVMDFGTYTVRVPSGWDVREIDEVVVLTSSDQEAIFFITQAISQGLHEKLIVDLTREIKPKSQRNKERIATLTALRDQRVVVTIVGDHRDRVKIFNSFKGKDVYSGMKEWIKK